MLTLAIVEDEPLARTRIETLLQSIGDVRVVGEAKTRVDAVQLLVDERPDVALLDVQLPDGSGFDVVESVPPDAVPLFIFLTAFERYAVRAFDVAAVDYLLKPVRPERLAAAIARARELAQPRVALERAVRPKRIAVTTEAETIALVDVKEIEVIEAAGNYVRIRWKTGQQLFRDSLTAVEEKLDPDQFARVHRSIIVNLDAIERLEPNAFGDYRISMRSGTVVPLSRRYRDRIALLVGHL